MTKPIYTGNSDGYSPPGFYKAGKNAEIDIHDEESIKKWKDILNLSRSELLYAIEEFGPVVRDIRRGLRNRDENAA